MKYSVVLVILECIFSLSRSTTSENLLPKRSLTQNPCANLRYGQLLCLDCATLALCIQQDNDWITMKIKTCVNEKQMYCDEEAKGCTFKTKCDLLQLGVVGLKFDCQNPGIYPDPYSCKYYHECNGLNQETRHVCPAGTGYSVSTGACVVQTNSAVCKQQQYKCEKPGAMDAWPGDANIFYVCYASRINGEFVLYPVLYRCRDDFIFDGENCIPGNSFDSQAAPIDLGTLTVTSTLAPTDLTCTGSSLIENPLDCHTYYVCRSRQLALYNCPAGYYFNTVTSSCATGIC